METVLDSTPAAHPMDDRQRLKRLCNALDAGYRYRSDEMLRFFLSATMQLWGLPEWMPVPDDVKVQITDALNVYAALVKNSPPFTDILGPVYMEMASSRGAKQHLGQFFTPQSIADMMSIMTIGSPPATAGRLYSACDPAAGSGVMMLSFVRTALSNWGAESLKRIAVTACDIDPICCRMAAVQMIANLNIHDLQLGDLLVLEGNSLGPWNALRIVVHAQLPPPAGEVLPPIAPERIAALHHAAAAHPDVGQLSLFPNEIAA